MSFTNIFKEILSKRKMFWSFIALISLVTIMLIVLVYSITSIFTNKANSIEIKESGAIVLSVDNKQKTATFLLSPNGGGSCSPWINSKIRVNKGEKLKFYVSGKICLGIHRIVESAIQDTILPPLPWNGPEGIDQDYNCNPKHRILSNDSLRKKYRICKNLPQGRILGVVSSNMPEPRPDSKIIDITKYKDDPYIVPETGDIWLTVNEIWLNRELMDTIKAKDLGINEAEYLFIKKNDYANVWYDDNAGEFSVSIEIVK